MRTTAGRASGITVDHSLTRDEAARFEGVLQTTLGSRRDRDRNLAAWAAAVAGAPPGPLRVTALAAASREFTPSLSTKQLRHVIENAPLDEVLLRRRLVRSAPLSQVLAFTVEHEWILHPESTTELDLYSLHAVGMDWTVPIGWVVERIPPSDRGGKVVGVDDSEAAAVLELLSQMRDDYEAVEPAVLLSASGPPPVILQAESFGINRALRDGLRSTIGEYVALVPGTYSDLRLRGEPLDRVEPNRQLQDYFAPMPAGAEPSPRELLDRSRVRRGREYAVAIPTDTGPEYALARPLPAVAPGELSGSRPEKRARELGQLACTVGDSHAAARLRVADLRHRSPDVLRRHALLMSVLSTVIAEPPPRVRL
jgi:hypothetical protein